MAAFPAQDARGDIQPPFLGDCPRCHESVLAIDLADGSGEVVVEPTEILERFPCPSCAQVAAMGHRRHGCTRCGMTGRLGEPLPLRGVAVDACGGGRIFTGERRDDEAVHRFHSCP